MVRIGIVEIFVTDQDRAHTFYTGVLGCTVRTDAAYGDDARWLTVVSPDDRDGPELSTFTRSSSGSRSVSLPSCAS